MARKELSVEPRQVIGKKVAALRRTGILPGNVFGHGIDSVAVQLSTEELQHTLRSAAANEVIDLTVAGEREARPVVIHRIQRNPLNSQPLHADFYQVSLREKLRAEVPLVFVGTSVAITTYNGVLVTSLESVHVEGLPLDIPANIEIDISVMRELEATIHVRDLRLPATVVVMNEPDVVLAKIASPSVTSGDEGTAAAAPTMVGTAEGDSEDESEESESEES